MFAKINIKGFDFAFVEPRGSTLTPEEFTEIVQFIQDQVDYEYNGKLSPYDLSDPEK